MKASSRRVCITARLRGCGLNRKYPGEADGEGKGGAVKSPEEHGKHVIIASEPTTYKMEEWHVVSQESGSCCG